VSNVPYVDQWVLLQEIPLARTSQAGWSYLWSTYWGQRPLLPRLLVLLSARHFHYAMLPFIVTSVAAQVSTLLILVWTIWRVFPGRGRAFWLSVIAAAHLLLSALQMEMFIEGIGIQYAIGYGAAVAAIALLGVRGDSRLRVELRFWAAVLAGAASSACLAIGPLVWPIMFFECWLARARAAHFAVLAAAGALVATAYAIGYTRPDIGMGVAGAIRHPVDAFRIVALVLGGPISLYSRSLGIAAGAFGIGVVAGVLVHAVRSRSLNPAATALALIGCFMIGSAVAIAIGRFSPEVLDFKSRNPMPSRYLAPTLAFWAVLFPVSIACWKGRGMGRVAALGSSLIVLGLTFGTWNWQWELSREWASISERYDAVGSGFLLGVSDPGYMSPILGDADLRAGIVDYMRRQHLSIFAEARARWIGQRIARIVPVSYRSICRATIHPDADLSPAGSVRMIGSITFDVARPWRAVDVLITDGIGTVKGLARTLPIYSEYAPAAYFLGYARDARPEDMRIFVLLAGTLFNCQL
jgi:hypothetical protein